MNAVHKTPLGIKVRETGMRNTLLLAGLSVVLGLGLVAAVPAAPTPGADASAVDKLIGQLGSADFEERDQATGALEAIGEPALDALRKAASSHADAEVRMRAGMLVRTIELRATSSSVLKPRRVHLVYKDVPVPEAVADFARKTGYAIVLNDPENKLAERKITLDTGDVTFWEAFDQFCDKAGLVEDAANGLRFRPGGPIRRGPVIQPVPLPAQPVPPQGAGQAFQVQIQVQVQQGGVVQLQPIAPGAGGAGGAVWVGPGVGVGPGGAREIILTDGTPKALPTDASGSVRVRAVDDRRFGDAPTGEYLIALQITPEPRLQLQNVTGVTVDRAVDDHGQMLTQAAEAVPPPPVVQPGVGGVARPGVVGRPILLRDSIHQYAAVRLKQGGKASKALKELSGTLSAQVLTEPKAGVTADDILKAAGKTFKSEDGSGYVKVLEVSKTGDDQISVRIEYQQPRDLIPATIEQPVPLNGPGPQPQPRGRGGRQAQPQAQVAQPAVATVAPIRVVGSGNGFALQDEKGNSLPLAGVQRNAARQGQGGVIFEETL